MEGVVGIVIGFFIALLVFLNISVPKDGVWSAIKSEEIVKFDGTFVKVFEYSEIEYREQELKKLKGEEKND